MKQIAATLDRAFNKTRMAVIGSALLNEPFVVFYALLPFILRKDLHASAFQIALFTMLKPAVSVFSFYWSSHISRHRGKLRSNMAAAGLLAYLPFLLLPIFHSRSYLILASALFMLFSKASIPAWIEILRINLKKEERARLFSLGSILAFTEGAILAFAIGRMLDGIAAGWQLLFLISSLLGILGVFLQWRIPVDIENQTKTREAFSYLQPWKTALQLLRTRRDFATFQIGTTLSGFGTMLAVPALAFFFADSLQLSYFEMTTGRCVFMAAGFILFSPLWTFLLNRLSINNLTGLIALGFALFPALVLISKFSAFLFYAAFFIYGATQAGSRLVWNLSGTLFAGDMDSSQYSGINVLMIGLRGLIAPFLGGILCELFGVVVVLILSALICGSGFWYMSLPSKAFGRL